MKTKPGFVGIAILIGVILLAYLIGQNRSLKEANSTSCLMKKLTMQDVKELVGDKTDFEIKQEYVDEINAKPLCKDICEEQLRYSQEHPNEWFADKDLRKTCIEVGIPLPR